jgi:hypothetical protein
MLREYDVPKTPTRVTTSAECLRQRRVNSGNIGAVRSHNQTVQKNMDLESSEPLRGVRRATYIMISPENDSHLDASLQDAL